MKDKKRETVCITFQAIVNQLECNQVMRDLLIPFGYTPETIAAARLQMETLEQLITRGQFHSGISKTATQTVQQLIGDATFRYRGHRTLAKAVLKGNSETRARLGLNGKLSLSYPLFIDTVERLYRAIQEDRAVEQILSPVSLTKREADSMMVAIDRIKAERANQLRVQEQLRQSQHEQQKAQAEAQAWIERFMSISSVALGKDSPLFGLLKGLS